MSVQSSTVCVLYVDICDSTRLYHELGDSAAHTLATNCLKIVAHAVGRNMGKIVKHTGDGAMVTFADVEQAYRAAAHIQHAMRAAPLKVKIGFHIGAVIIADGDVFGNTVMVAERVMARSGPGEILMTRACVDTLSAAARATVRLLDTAVVDGQPDTEIYRVLGESAGETTLSPALERVKEAGRALILSFRGDVIRMDAQAAPLAIGREAHCRIVVSNDCTSRHHATIAPHGNGFVLTDRSTNGTYLVDANGNEQFLRRESAVLTGGGAISIGRVPRESAGALIRFRTEDIAVASRQPKLRSARGRHGAQAIYTATVGPGHAARQFASWM